MDGQGRLPRSYELMSVAWQGIGLFAIAENQIDRVLESYTSRIPEDLQKVLLRRLNSDDRRSGLSVFLRSQGLTDEYPDLCDMFRRVKITRNRLAHGTLTYIAPDDPDDDDRIDAADRIREGLGIIGNKGTGYLAAAEVEEFSSEAKRLVGLLGMLILETGAERGAPPEIDSAGFIKLPWGARMRLTTPRRPMPISRAL